MNQKIGLAGIIIAALGLTGIVGYRNTHRLPENLKLDLLSEKVVCEPDNFDPKLIPEEVTIEVSTFVNGKHSVGYGSSEPGPMYSGPIWREGEYVVPPLHDILQRAGIIGIYGTHPDSLDYRKGFVNEEARTGRVEVRYMIDAQKYVREKNEEDNVVQFRLLSERLDAMRRRLEQDINFHIRQRAQQLEFKPKIEELERAGYLVQKIR